MLNQDNNDFYNNKKWRRKAAAILSRDNYQDKYQRRYGRAEPAEIVHHILPLDLYPELAYTDYNLISVSRRTHLMLHTADGSLSKRGKELSEMIARRHGIPLRDPGPASNYRTGGKGYAIK